MIEEEIDIQAHLYEDSCHNPSIQRHFTDGALWMKGEIIKKACNEFDSFLDYLLESNRINFEEREDNEWIYRFRKALEEQQ